jgi:hypothetical protein
MNRLEQIRDRLKRATPSNPYSSSNPSGYYVGGKMIVAPADLALLLAVAEAAVVAHEPDELCHGWTSYCALCSALAPLLAEGPGEGT